MNRVIGEDLRRRFYGQMLLIRRFEEMVLDLFAKGELNGTTHAYIGQEANAAAVLNQLHKDDIVVSNHRCHGHYLARTDDDVGLLAELMGRDGGICAGRGGSQHLCHDNFYSNGIQGNMVPVAAGMAFAEKLKGTGAIGLLFIGDGTLGQGTVYETFNMISLWQVPLLVIVENNQYAQTTPLSLNFAGSFTSRAAAFGLSTGEIESNDVEALFSRFSKIIDRVRSNNSPHVEIIHTYRLCAHSKSDDYRSETEIAKWRTKDPLTVLGARLPEQTKQAIESKVRERLAQTLSTTRKMSFAS